jgi:hypothetical protein
MNNDDFIHGPMAAKSDYVVVRQIPDIYPRDEYDYGYFAEGVVVNAEGAGGAGSGIDPSRIKKICKSHAQFQ